MATEETDNPDLRDRGFIYWRLLSTDPEAAKMVVLGDKPVIEDDTFKLDPSLLNVLIEQIATLSSVYHKPPDAFVIRRGAGTGMDGGENNGSDDEDEEYGGGGDGEVDLLDMGGMNVTDGAPAGGVRMRCFTSFLASCPTLTFFCVDLAYHSPTCRLLCFAFAVPRNRVVLKSLLDLCRIARRFICRWNFPTYLRPMKLTVWLSN
jgi:hypothetical protein